jgi:hypothetical protein
MYSFTKFCLFLLIFCGALAGCGYRPLVASFPEGDGAIYIPIAENHTSFAGLSTPLTNALRLETKAVGIRVLTSSGTGAPTLFVAIKSVEQRPGMVARRDKTLYPIDIIQTIRVAVHIAEGEQILLRPKIFEAAGRSFAEGDLQTEIVLAEERRYGILERIAADIVAYAFTRQ